MLLRWRARSGPNRRAGGRVGHRVLHDAGAGILKPRLCAFVRLERAQGGVQVLRDELGRRPKDGRVRHERDAPNPEPSRLRQHGLSQLQAVCFVARHVSQIDEDRIRYRPSAEEGPERFLSCRASHEPRPFNAKHAVANLDGEAGGQVGEVAFGSWQGAYSRGGARGGFAGRGDPTASCLP